MKTTDIAAIRQSRNILSINRDEWGTNYKYVFVHGLSGWGSYDLKNKFVKYWGMLGGDLLKQLSKEGFSCCSASVDPCGSAWDRACELYAQLTGGVVDYGEEHSTRCKHNRYGKDYSDCPLIKNWDSDNKINLIGHSFGGITIRMLAALMENGSENERRTTTDGSISPLFTGGKGAWIYSLTAVATPHNGTTVYNAESDIGDELTPAQKFMSDMVSKFTQNNTDGRLETDYADYDMKVDNALKLNETLTNQDGLYYFSVPCSSVQKREDGTYYPIKNITEITFIAASIMMGKYAGMTDGGYIINETWRENDGLVNTISAAAPFNAESKKFDKNDIKPGIWNIMPVFKGDHMSLQGGLFKHSDILSYYTNHLDMINSIK